MPNWVWVVVVIVALLAGALVREHWRLRALETWSRTRGFTLLRPFAPADHPRIAALGSRFSGRDNMRWATGASGRAADTDVTVAEFEYTPTGRKTGVWFTLVAWPVRSAAGPLLLTPRGRGLFDAAMSAVVGRSDADSAGLQITTEGALVVHGDPAVREAWLTDDRRRALEAWPHGGQFALMDGWAGWKTEGLITPARLDDLLARLAEVRPVFE
jgi:hypothetical protein